MSLHRNVYGSEPGFSGLFRLLDDFDNYSRTIDPEGHGLRRTSAASALNPRFDIRETETAYELHGELPGVEKQNISIEFTEPQTIVIRGKVERSYSSSKASPASKSGMITEHGEMHPHPHKATVEDEATEQAKEQGAETQVANRPKQHTEKHRAASERFWLSERSVGDFMRTFSFPARVDQDAVSANLNNGILSIVVPKAKKAEARRIAIL